MDRVGSDFLGVVNQIKQKFQLVPLVVQLPIGQEERFEGVVDLVKMCAMTWEMGKLDTTIVERAIPHYLEETAQRLHHELEEKVAESSDELLEHFLEKGFLSVSELRTGIRNLTLQHRGVPIFCGSALKNMGVRPLLDGVVDYLPSPADVPPVEGVHPRTDEKMRRFSSPEEPLAALVFKVATDPYVGHLRYFRIYSGSLKTGSYVYNCTKGQRERVARILEMHANYRIDRDQMSAGEIGAVVGLKNADTGDSLCDEESPIQLESISFAEPVIAVAIETRSRGSQEKLAQALVKLAQEDPSFRVKQDKETGQTIISGMGELHLEIIMERLRREFGLDVNSGEPQVAYRESIRKKAKARGQYIHQTGGKGQYGDVVLEVEPREDGEDVFRDDTKGGVIPREFISSIKAGVEQAMYSGVLGGYPFVNVKANLLDGSYHPVDSNEHAFRTAAFVAFRKAVQQADPFVLEPIMKVEVRTPVEFLGDIIADLSSRRGQIVSTDEAENTRIIVAYAPLAELFGYVTRLRSLSRGKALPNIEFASYKELPPDRAKQLLGK
jgi:elongation factor G